MNNEEAQTDESVPPHQCIDKQLCQLETHLLGEIRRLKRAITGEVEPDNEKSPGRPDCSLREVLASAPERIATIREVACKEIEEIRSTLFTL